MFVVLCSGVPASPSGGRKARESDGRNQQCGESVRGKSGRRDTVLYGKTSLGKSDPESALAWWAESGELRRSGCHVATGLGKSVTKRYKFVASNVG